MLRRLPPALASCYALAYEPSLEALSFTYDMATGLKRAWLLYNIKKEHMEDE